MDERDDETERTNGGDVKRSRAAEDLTLYGVLHRMLTMIFVPDSNNSSSGAGAATPVLRRIKISVCENVPLVKDASRNTGRSIIRWTRRGSPLRALLVISAGTIILVTFTGLLVFMLFFLAATVNAIVIALLVSLAAAGGFLALFFASVTAIYIGALSVAAFVISAATISAIVAVLIATGWIGFFWSIWLVTKKSVGVAKHSLSMTGSAISAYSSARHLRRYSEADKASD